MVKITYWINVGKRMLLKILKEDYVILDGDGLEKEMGEVLLIVLLLN